MKSLAAALAIAAALFCGGVLYSRSLTDKSDSILKTVDTIEVCINDNDFEAAQRHIDKLARELYDFEHFFLATGDHEETDNIEINIAELRSFAEEKMKAEALGKTYIIEYLIKHLPKNSSLSIQNIL